MFQQWNNSIDTLLLTCIEGKLQLSPSSGSIDSIYSLRNNAPPIVKCSNLNCFLLEKTRLLSSRRSLFYLQNSYELHSEKLIQMFRQNGL